jgi:DNA polymerase-3 subunit beta
MHVSCLQQNLSRALAIVGRAVATRSNLPVLQNVKIGTDSSSNSDVQIGTS